MIKSAKNFTPLMYRELGPIMPLQQDWKLSTYASEREGYLLLTSAQAPQSQFKHNNVVSTELLLRPLEHWMIHQACMHTDN